LADRLRQNKWLSAARTSRAIRSVVKVKFCWEERHIVDVPRPVVGGVDDAVWSSRTRAYDVLAGVPEFNRRPVALDVMRRVTDQPVITMPAETKRLIVIWARRDFERCVWKIRSVPRFGCCAVTIGDGE